MWTHSGILRGPGASVSARKPGRISGSGQPGTSKITAEAAVYQDPARIHRSSVPFRLRSIKFYLARIIS